ncbi:bifunctional diaminohydroxyphosphoribosylaminopyrimidine deaminase/5-amino-6-(5-phosphoribosylamino)uracil reductase RibD [Desulfuribacillus alkaliarsenatis]|uniref:Riboflavin biosynthesis protein RibD n=1 Tax=Desulfuribacillus alkaliarsenatis TaxID=766136 RepID=A0A1E5G5M5_9FIRM|nr:bifunctional diaminohydroxyphosphoribosylaminopyrimidine deaminase/5-amino-6-(5-phosphoribosylamino)uracil reductase RibD [Desulfuribacillus alkaliarsenatis]OEF98490.1 riboflavin biosynthesis protein RibD [Desulfuribacillus alkaliarsenatis]
MTAVEYMELAIKLAASAIGRTSPNPLVGAVVVKNQRIIGMGAHLCAGKEHAEVNALNMAGIEAKGATMYVTLEPCNHYGKTPPCTERIIKEGISKVYVASLDPNPLVAGEGIKRLEAAGIEVEIGLLEHKEKQLNEVFHKFITKKEPFIILKTAMTLDGKIATRTNDSKWITNEASRNKVHQIRNQVDGIMVGVHTIIADNPILTTRLPEGGINPTRIILDSKLSIPESAQVLDMNVAPTIIACTEKRDKNKAIRLEKLGVKVIVCKEMENRIDIADCLKRLGEAGITSVLVEGGSQVHGSFLEAQKHDKFMVFIAPKIIGGESAITAFGGRGLELMSQAIQLDNIEIEQLDNDILITGYPKKQRKDR